MASTSQKRLSSNSLTPPPMKSARMDTDYSAATQSPGVQIEVDRNDPLGKYNDEINARIMYQLDPELNADGLTQPVFSIILRIIIQVVSHYTASSIDKSYLDRAARQSLFEEYHELPSIIADALKKRDFKDIRTLRMYHFDLEVSNLFNADSASPAILQNTRSNKEMAGTSESNNQAFINATESSWSGQFKGIAASVLWHHITHYYNNTTQYVNYVAIIQSSGTGKSRTIDELSKTILTIPLCLRDKHSAGYPYADDEVRDFLTLPENEQTAHLHALAFLLALFEHTKAVLSQAQLDDYSKVTTFFRGYMTTDQRKAFYCDVVDLARGYANNASKKSGSTVGSLELKDKKMIEYVQVAFKSLQGVIPLQKTKSLEPILLIAWDEAHTLSPKDDHRSSNFVALCRVLRELINSPIFSIFSSTTSKMTLFSPPSAVGASARVYNLKCSLMPPFCDFGLDVLVMDSKNKVSLDAGRSLDEFITDEYMCHLGRPLFGLHYEYGNESVRKDLLTFAAMKLVRDEITERLALSPIQKIACLSFRLPIEFNSTAYASRKHDEDLVKSHMRICLKVDASHKFMHTLSASEPFLSEAAYYVTNRHSLAEGRRLAVEAFQELTESFTIHTGDQGEFLALLLCTLARDATVGMPDREGAPRSRSFGLAEFLCDNLICNKLASEETQRDLKSLRSDFPNARLHFNHFIKAHEQSVVTQENILLLMARGAAFLCANGQSGVDFILPFLRDGVKMMTKNSGFILAQVKNDEKYGASVEKKLFKRMNPYEVGILKKGVAPPPIIRIVFALASATPSVHVTRHEPSDEYKNIIYDIWIAGITADVLSPIDRVLEDMWKGVLQVSYGWKHLFDTISKDAKTMRRSTDVASGEHVAHWDRWSG